jgi:hypothetical protein
MTQKLSPKSRNSVKLDDAIIHDAKIGVRLRAAEAESIHQDIMLQVETLEANDVGSFYASDIPLELLVKTAAILRHRHQNDIDAAESAANLINACERIRVKSINAIGLYQNRLEPVPFADAVAEITGDSNSTRAKIVFKRLLAVKYGAQKDESENASDITTVANTQLSHYKQFGMPKSEVAELKELLQEAKKQGFR